VPDGLHCEGRDGLGGLAQVYSRSVPKEGRDELTALNQILQDTATEIIDIASIEHTQGVEQADYNEKAAHYAKRLAQVGAQLVAKHADPAPLMVEASNAAQLERMMSQEPIAQVLFEINITLFSKIGVKTSICSAYYATETAIRFSGRHGPYHGGSIAYRGSSCEL